MQSLYLHSQNEQDIYLASLKEPREFSSAGSEHLPYKQRVTGSNPVTPTKREFKVLQKPVNRMIYRLLCF